jgi:DNA polymerase III delta subunit
VHVFIGENRYALREELHRWMREFSAKHGLENLIQVDGVHLSLRALLDEVSVSPFIAARRLVIVWGIPRWSKEEMNVLQQSVHPSTIVLFNESAPDRRLAGVKELLANASVKEFAALSGKALRDWAKAHALRCGGTLEEPALDQLLSIVGEDQDMLAEEIAKLTIGRSTVRAEDVSALAVASGEQEVWQLTNVLSQGDQERALAYARTLLRSGEDPYSLWNVLLWLLRSLTSVALSVAEGERNPAKIASMSGVPFPTARTLAPMASRASPAVLRELLDWAVQADRDLKTGGLRATVEASQELVALIDALIVRMIGAQRGEVLRSRSA